MCTTFGAVGVGLVEQAVSVSVLRTTAATAAAAVRGIRRFIPIVPFSDSDMSSTVAFGLPFLMISQL
jgi:hypothetical protein